MFSGFSDHTCWVLPRALAEAAQQKAGQTWLRCSDGGVLTFEQAARDAETVAGHLHALGVRPGDHVALMMGNCIDFVRAWAGIGRLGAVAVLLNTELQGVFLEHQLRNSEARLVITAPQQLAAILEVGSQVQTLETVLLTGAPPEALEGRMPDASLRPLRWDDWQSAAPYHGDFPRYDQIAAIMYTSGTSGPSKGVLMTHAQCTLYGIGMVEALEVRQDDVYYITLPLFHANALLMQLGTTLLAQIPAFMRTRFSATHWIGDVREQGVTLTNMLGATAAFVIAQPPSARDRAHRLRAMLNAPNLPAHEAIFRERFGVADILSGFGMTEVASPVIGKLGRPAPGAAGWIDAARYEVIVADSATDLPVPDGEVGELLVRPRIPFTMMAGYHRMPEKTMAAWRNAWFHTGDAATIVDGVVTYIDRIDDCIRRRGQNISPSEIEASLARLADIAEVSAYAAVSDIPGAEAEIVLAIVRAAGSAATAENIGALAEAALPKFARPRYVRLLDALPKTPTAKVQRAVLRRQGVQGAVDRDHLRPTTPPNFPKKTS
ncbi:MAG: AMP-binding protein [Pseudorhodoferax sp.]